jgi:hypothetical protein
MHGFRLSPPSGYSGHYGPPTGLAGAIGAGAGGIPAIEPLIILVGLPLVAAIGGWLLAVREPSAIARKALE